GTGGDAPDIDSEDDSSYAWVVFRQGLADGSVRVLGRRLRGSLFDDPVDVGPGAENGTQPRIDLNGRGQGVAGSQGAATRTPFAALLRNDAFAAPFALSGASGVDPQPQPAVAEGGTGIIAWIEGPSAATAVVRGLGFDAQGKTVATAQLSNPAFGAVDAA